MSTIQACGEWKWRPDLVNSSSDNQIQVYADKYVMQSDMGIINARMLKPNITGIGIHTLRVVKANPLDESRQVHAGGPEISNTTIFRHLAESGRDENELELLIPNPSTAWHYLGTLYSTPISLDHDGRFQFGVDPEENSNDPIEFTWSGGTKEKDEDVCQHEFLVPDRDDEGNIFHCEVCDERFPRHPSLIPKERSTGSTTPLSAEATLEIMSEFRNGMTTWTSAVKQLTISAEEFIKTMRELFPPKPIYEEVYAIGSAPSVRTQIGEEPVRTICPERVEKMFSGGIEWTDAEAEDVDNDDELREITTITTEENKRMQQQVITVEFIDGTSQRVEVDRKEWLIGEARRAKTRQQLESGGIVY